MSTTMTPTEGTGQLKRTGHAVDELLDKIGG
jgi:hypothetical protein